MSVGPVGSVGAAGGGMPSPSITPIDSSSGPTDKPVSQCRFTIPSYSITTTTRTIKRNEHRDIRLLEPTKRAKGELNP